MAYKPGETVVIVTYDRATVHDFHLAVKPREHPRDCGASLLQIMAMPPHGYDFNQTSEHGIGAPGYSGPLNGIKKSKASRGQASKRQPHLHSRRIQS